MRRLTNVSNGGGKLPVLISYFLGKKNVLNIKYCSAKFVKEIVKKLKNYLRLAGPIYFQTIPGPSKTSAHDV